MMNTTDTSRRGFLSGLATGAALVATADLPAAAAEPSAQDVFDGRGTYERLSLGYIPVRLGLEKPFSVLHISDTHLTAAYETESRGTRDSAARRTRTFGGQQERALASSLAWAKKNTDYVLHTGDLIDFQSEANFDLVRKYFGDTMFGSMGNHEFYTYTPDEKIRSDEDFKDRSWPILKAKHVLDPRFSAKTVNGVEFICLDDTFGTVQPDLVERFKAEAAKGLPIVLCMHVPFFDDDIMSAAWKFWYHSGTKEGALPPVQVKGDYLRQRKDPVTSGFIAYLKGLPQLKAVLVGHEHFDMQGDFSPTARQYIVGGNFLYRAQEVRFL